MNVQVFRFEIDETSKGLYRVALWVGASLVDRRKDVPGVAIERVKRGLILEAAGLTI